MSDLPFHYPDAAPPNAGAPEPRPHRRHRWVVTEAGVECPCGRSQDLAAVKRGRTNRRAGNDAERAIAKAYGGKRTGQYGGPDDVQVGELFVVQSKAGGWFSNRYWDELVKLPRTGGRVPTLVVSDRPGPGRRTRRLVIRTLEDDIALHGEQR